MFFLFFFSFFFFFSFLELWVDCRFEWMRTDDVPVDFHYCRIYEDGLITHERTQCFCLDTRREEKKRGHAIAQLCYTTPSVQRELALICLI